MGEIIEYYFKVKINPEKNLLSHLFNSVEATPLYGAVLLNPGSRCNVRW